MLTCHTHRWLWSLGPLALLWLAANVLTGWTATPVINAPPSGTADHFLSVILSWAAAFWPYLSFGLLIGFFAGWLARNGRSPTAGWAWLVPVLCVVWLLGVALLVSGYGNMRPDPWMWIGLVLFGVWLLGCSAGCALRALISPRQLPLRPDSGLTLPANPEKAKTKAARELYEWRAHREPRRIVLAGSVPSQSTRNSLLAAAREELAPMPILDQMQVDVDAPPGFEGMALTALRHLALLDKGTAGLADSRYTLTGSVATPARREAALLAARSLPANFTLARVDLGPVLVSGGPIEVEAPVIAPYVWRAERKDGVLLLSGYVPSVEVRERMLKAAHARFPQERVDDGLLPGAGQPSGLEGMATTIFGLLSRLQTGHATLQDMQLTLVGEAASTSQQSLVRQAVTLLPAGFSLQHLDLTVSPTPATPPKT